MRYYSIVITDPTNGNVITPASLRGVSPSATYTSFLNNATLTAALNVEIDAPVYSFAKPSGAAYVRVWGISLQEISQSSDLNGKAIQVYAGMQKGLPLANPKQNGLIVQGYIFQAFGNWVGTDMTLDIVIVPSPTTNAPPNIVIDWKKGTPLSQAIASTLKTAFPDYKEPVIDISPDLVLSSDEPGFYSNIATFAQYVKQVSLGIIQTNYAGVDIILKEKTFVVYDGTNEASPTQIKFQDMIGQPTWIGPSAVSVKFVMRADLAVGGFLKFPNWPKANIPVFATSQTVSPLTNENLTFQGTFKITSVHHLGNFRQPDASSWVTVVEATAPPVSTKAA